MEKFASWFIERDKRMMEAHLKREIKTLKKEMRQLEEERDRMRDHLHRIETLIEKQKEMDATLTDAAKGGV